MKNCRISICCFLVLLSGCSNYEIDSTEKWCEWITDDNAVDRHSPFWAVFPGWSYNAEAIRSDLVSILNNAYMERVEGQTDVVVTRERTELHIVNLAVFLVMAPNEFVAAWRTPIEKAKRGQLDLRGDIGLCVFNVAANFFDSVHIHYVYIDPFGRSGDEEVVVIDNERAERAKSIPGGGVLIL